MEREKVTGFCYYRDEELTEWRRISGIILVVLMVLTVVLSVWTKELATLLIDVFFWYSWLPWRVRIDSVTIPELVLSFQTPECRRFQRAPRCVAASSGRKCPSFRSQPWKEHVQYLPGIVL